MDDYEIQEYYVKPFDSMGQALELSCAMLFPYDPPTSSLPSRHEDDENAINRGANALFRLAYCDLIFHGGKFQNPEGSDELTKKYSLIYPMELILHQHNPLYIDDIHTSWCGHEAWITDEGEKFYEENKDNLLEALTKRFEDYGVGFEKGHILKSPPTPPTKSPITFF